MAVKSILIKTLFISLISFSCKPNKNNPGNYSATQDTAMSKDSEKATQQEVNNTNALLSSEDKLEYIKDSLRILAENIKKQNPDPLELIKSEIIYDSDFKPTLVAEVKNNRKDEVIGLELTINPNEHYEQKCQIIKKKIKISILPNNTVLIKRKITDQVENGCLKLERARISLGDYILANGKIKHPPNIFIEDKPDE